MPSDSFIPPPIPVHLASYPTIGGLVIPYIAPRHRNGKAALGLVDPIRQGFCLRERRCGVCATHLADKMVFLMRGMDLQRKSTIEPALCPPCAAYTQQACPMVGGFMAHYRNTSPVFVERRCGDPECLCRFWLPSADQSARLGAHSESWYALWTLQYRLIRDEAGRLAAGFAGLRVLGLREIRQPSIPAENRAS